MKNSIVAFFKAINYTALRQSFLEVIFLTIIAVLPLVINVVIAWLSIKNNTLGQAFYSKIIPGEILSYCMSFLAPSLYLLTKSQGTEYKLPLLHFFSIGTLLLYTCTLVLYLVAKNNWVNNIDMKHQEVGTYLNLTIIFFFLTIFFRIYAVFHGKGISNWSARRKFEQDTFNAKFSQSINSQP